MELIKIKTDPNASINKIDENTTYGQQGLTKREHFAAMAMQGLLSSLEPRNNPTIEFLSEDSVKMADALIKALNKEA